MPPPWWRDRAGSCGDRQLTINFLRKSPAGAIVADARLLKVGRLSAGEVILTSEHSDEPLAHIVSTWSVPKS